MTTEQIVVLLLDLRLWPIWSTGWDAMKWFAEAGRMVGAWKVGDLEIQGEHTGRHQKKEALTLSG